MNEDYLVIGMDQDEQFRAYAVISTGLVEEARARHNASPTAAAALGRALTAGVLMSAGLKGDDVLTLRILGDGPLGAIVVSTGADGFVRGYVQHPEADLPSKNGKLDVGGGVGAEGNLLVTKNMGLKDPYTGSIPLVSGEIAEDIANYYAKSEQIPSVVALGVLVNTDITVKSAGGYLVQAVPGATPEALLALEERAVNLPTISQLYDQGKTPEDVLQSLLGSNFSILDRRPIGFRCACSREKLEKILISMGEVEIRDMIEQQKETEVTCHFCRDIYKFGWDELDQILCKAKE